MATATFTENFIVINAEKSVKDAFDIIEELSPQYVIVSRISGEEHYHYVFLTKLLESYLDHCKTERDPSSEKLTDFLVLHEYDGVKTRTISIQDPTTDPQLEEICSKVPKGEFEVLTDNNQKIIGIMDSIKLDKTANYEIRGIDYQDKLIQNVEEIQKGEKTVQLFAICPECENPIEKCVCVCPYCGEHEICECALFEAATGGSGFCDRSCDDKGEPEEELPQQQDEEREERQPQEEIPTRRSFRRSFFSKGPPEPKMRGSKNTSQEKTTTEITKYASATLDENIPLDENSKFEIVMKSSKPADGKAGEVIIKEVDKKQKETKLTVMVMSDPPGFVEFVGDTYKEMTIPLETKDSKAIDFIIKPKKSGWCTIKAQFYHKGNYAGNVGVKTKVVEGKPDSRQASSTSSMNMDFQNKGPDLSIHILEMASTPQKLEYMIMAISEKLGYPQKVFQKISLRSNPEKYFSEFFKDIEDFGFEDDEDFDPQVVEDNLVSKGQNLYTELFPSDFQEFFWNNKENIQSIQVISQEPWIPWEIIKPWKSSDDGPNIEDDFLCVKYAFTRWLENIPIKKKTKIEKIKLVVPTDTGLPAAINEYKWIKQFARQAGLKEENVTRDKKYVEVMRSLKEGDFDILHFSTHGRYEKTYAKMSALVLQDDKLLRAESINGITANFGQNNPVVILNACETGRQGFSLTGMGSWADAFLKAKASAFIGTLWSIADETAQEFTKSLYQNLNDKIPLDEAVRLARKKARQEGDPSWLAYTLYSPSNTLITIGE